MTTNSEPSTIKLAIASARSELCQARRGFALQCLSKYYVGSNWLFKNYRMVNF